MAKFKYTARLVREFSVEVEAEDEYEAIRQGELATEKLSANMPCTTPEGDEVPWWWDFQSVEKESNNE